MPARTKKPPTNGSTASDVEVVGDPIHIQELATSTIAVPILGTSPLIIHRFSEKAKRQMLDNMQGKKNAKQPKNPKEEYLDAFYRFNDSDRENGPFGFPVIGFKAATVGGARFYGQVTMTGLKQCIFFHGEVGVDRQMLARIEGEPDMREDVVRVNRGGTDLRYRPIFTEWESTLYVEYVTSMLTRDSVTSLINAGGRGVGIGEWRVEKGGDFGTFRVHPTKPIVSAVL